MRCRHRGCTRERSRGGWRERRAGGAPETGERRAPVSRRTPPLLPASLDQTRREAFSMDLFLRDLKFALRSLSRSRGILVVMVVVLALGIGANAAIFSVVRGVLLHPLSYPSAERLVVLPARHRPNEMGAEVSVANFLDWRRESRSFESLGAWGPASANVTG